MSKKNRALQVEALTFSDTFDNVVDKYFRNRASHRAEDSGVFDIERIVKEYAGKLLRSRQEYAISPSGFTTRIQWASLCFEIEEDVFVTLMAKGSAAMRASQGDEYEVTVTAATPEAAAEALAKFRKEFLPQVEGWKGRPSLS